MRLHIRAQYVSQTKMKIGKRTKARGRQAVNCVIAPARGNPYVHVRCRLITTNSHAKWKKLDYNKKIGKKNKTLNLKSVFLLYYFPSKKLLPCI